MSKASKTARDEQFVSAMLRCHSVSQAARESNIPIRTARTLAADPRILQMIEDGKKKTLEGAYTALRDSLVEAVQTLRAIATDENASPSTRAYAAQMILQNALPYCKAVDFDKRLHELEGLTEEGAI